MNDRFFFFTKFQDILLRQSQKITQKTHNGAVYLLHAVSKTNAEILPKVIDYWRENGYLITPM